MNFNGGWRRMKTLNDLSCVELTTAIIGDDDTKPQQVARIACQTCKNTDQFPLTGPINAQHIRKRFERKGWDIGKGKGWCPTCSGKPVQRPTLTIVNNEAPVHMAEVTSEDAPNPELMTRDQRKAVRRLLDAHFDDAAGQYLEEIPEYSDEMVGLETGVSVAVVALYRDREYGELRPKIDTKAVMSALASAERVADVELTKITKDITHLADRFEKWDTNVKRLMMEYIDRQSKLISVDLEKKAKEAIRDFLASYREDALKHIEGTLIDNKAEMEKLFGDQIKQTEVNLNIVRTNTVTLREVVEEKLRRAMGLKL